MSNQVHLLPEDRCSDVLTDEPAEEAEDGDGNGECPVPVNNDCHSSGVWPEVADQEYHDKQQTDQGEEAGQPDKGLELREW